MANPGAWLLVEITNRTEHTFVLDGDWLCKGSWQSSKREPLRPTAVSVIAFRRSHFGGVSGAIWFVDAAEHGVYVSLAFHVPRLRAGRFACHAGGPPADLKAEPAAAPRLVSGVCQTGLDGACHWTCTTSTWQTFVALTILPSAARWEPQRAFPLVAATDEAPATPPQTGAAEGAPTSGSNGAPAAAEPVQLSDSTALVAQGRAEVTPELDTAMKEAHEAAVSFIAQTRPKDCCDGIARSLKACGGGLCGGLATCVGAPIQGALQGKSICSKVVGLVRGLVAGVVGGAVVSAGGCCFGVAQLVRGAVNTPASVRGRNQHRVWDDDLGEWTDIDLVELEREVAAEGSDDEDVTDDHASGTGALGGTNGGTVTDTELYDLLDVGPTATAGEIKKAYYRAARSCHPDKNPGDAEAKEKFQKLAHAYQVLSDPVTREKYNREGKDGVMDREMRMDPIVFFNLLFGSDRFEPWIGEFYIALQLDQVTRLGVPREEDLEEQWQEKLINGSSSMMQRVAKKQYRREVRCACQLRDRLTRHVLGRDEAGWEEEMRVEARELSLSQFGPELLLALGESYGLQADLHLAEELVGRHSLKKRAAALRRTSLTMRHNARFYKNAAGSLLRAKRVHDLARKADKARESGVEGSDKQSESVSSMLDDALPSFLQTAWSAVVTDIDSLVEDVAQKLLMDKSTPWQIRLRRAQALQRLGQIFCEVGREAQREKNGPRTLTSEAAKAIFLEALTGSVRER